VKNNGYLMKSHRTQQGVVLAVALIMLVLVTLLGMSAMRSTIMEERMASNSRNENIAFQLAETALRQAEFNLNAAPQATQLIDALSLSVGLGSCEILLNTRNFLLPASWDAAACLYAGEAYSGGPARTPHYFIEYMPTPDPTGSGGSRECFYRITARGYGPDSNSAVTLQTTFRFDACS